MKRKLNIIITALLITVLFLNQLPSSVFASVSSTSEINGLVTYYDEIEIIMTPKEVWNGGYNATVTLKNKTDKQLTNWCIELVTDNDIVNIWNADIISHKEGVYTIANAGWNSIIPAKGEISFGITGVGEFDPNLQKRVPVHKTVDNVSVDIELTEDQAMTLEIKPYVDEVMFPSDMPGLIGTPYEFSVEGNFGKAYLHFGFDEELLEREGFDPVVYYFDEENQILEELETTVDGNVATAYTAHFSKYVLLDREIYEREKTWVDTWGIENYKKIFLTFMIDCSESTSRSDPDRKRVELARRIVSNAPDNCYIRVCAFDKTVRDLTKGFTRDRHAIENVLVNRHIISDGRTMMYGALYDAVNRCYASGDDVYKMVVLITDGATEDERRHKTVTAYAVRSDVRVYTVCLGGESAREEYENLLIPVAVRTKGKAYLIDENLTFDDVFDGIQGGIDILKDTDGDGIPDYYEDNLVSFNGKKIYLDKNSVDTDGDGLYDNEEVVKISYKLSKDKTKAVITGRILSSPEVEDTDHDGVTDDEELIIGTDPLKNDTDNDGLDDGFECSIGYDPCDGNYDNDSFTDKEEYEKGTSPYLYDKSFGDYILDFLKGAILGDFITEPDSVPMLLGQIAGNFIPLIDIRDIVAGVHNKDGLGIALSGAGLISGAGDIVKAADFVSKFLIKNSDNAALIYDAVKSVDKSYPNITKTFLKNEDVLKVFNRMADSGKCRLTKSETKSVISMLEKAGYGKDIKKTSNVLNIERVVDVGEDTWSSLKPFERGKVIDEVINGHKAGIGLGSNFPVFDRLVENERMVVSTKSLDLDLQSYKTPSKIKTRLNSYIREMECFEKEYLMNPKRSDTYKWIKGRYDKKVLEVVLPDTIISDDVAKCLKEYAENIVCKDNTDYVWEVRYVIGKE